MHHMGNSGKFAVIAGIVAALLLVLTAMTLAEPVFLAFLGVLGLACLAAAAEILVRGRRAVLLAVGAGASVTVGFALAFLSTWELAFAGQSSFLGTPLPTDDPDDYFYWAAASGLATLTVLFLGAAWPGSLRAVGGSHARKRTPQRGAQRGPGPRPPARLPAAAKRPPSSAARSSTTRSSTTRSSAAGTAAAPGRKLGPKAKTNPAPRR